MSGFAKTPAAPAALPPRYEWIVTKIVEGLDVSEAEAVRVLDLPGAAARRASFTDPSPRKASFAHGDGRAPSADDDGREDPPSFRALLAGAGRQSLFVFHQPRSAGLPEVRPAPRGMV